MTDLISRADAIELLTEIVFDEPPYFDSETLCRLYAEEQINTLPSDETAETEPIVIRSKTLMPTKDFKEWAKRIREVNPNAVVIPCDAEVASAEAETTKVVGINDADRPKVGGIYQTTAPSAEAVQGEWVRKVKEYNDCDGHRFVYWYECDQCGARPPKDQWKNEWHSNYCPSCGARMKGGAE